MNFDLSCGSFEVDIGYLTGNAHRDAFVRIFQAVMFENREVLSSISVDPRELYDQHRDHVVLDLCGPQFRAMRITFDNPSFELLATSTSPVQGPRRLEEFKE